MAQLSLKDLLDSLRDEIQIRSKQWENVILNFSEAYEKAVKEHESNLPEKMSDEGLLIIFGMIAAGSTAWLAGGWVVAMTPIASAISKLGERAAVAPDAETLQTSGAPSSANTHFRFLKSSLNTVVANMLAYIQRCRYKLNENGDIVISADEKKNIDQLVQTSPFWYPPPTLSKWDETLQKEMAIEFEIGFWAEWAKRLKKATSNQVHGYNFDKASKRLEILNVKILSINGAGRPSLHDIIIDGAKKGMTRSIGGGMNNKWWAGEVMLWGESYKPKKTFGDPLPTIVNNYMLNQMLAPYDINTVKRGVDYLAKMGINILSLKRSPSE